MMCSYDAYVDNISNTISNFHSELKNTGFVLKKRNTFFKLFMPVATIWS